MTKPRKNTESFSSETEDWLTELMSGSETCSTAPAKSAKRKSNSISTYHDPELLCKVSCSTKVLSGQANLIIVRRRVIRTKKYHDFKNKIASMVAEQMRSSSKAIPSRGTLYKVCIAYDTQGFGVDVDNACKAILDALIGTAIDDDSRITELNVTKNTHRKQPKLEIAVYTTGFRDLPPSRATSETKWAKARRSKVTTIRKKRAKSSRGTVIGRVKR